MDGILDTNDNHEPEEGMGSNPLTTQKKCALNSEGTSTSQQSLTPNNYVQPLPLLRV